MSSEEKTAHYTVYATEILNTFIDEMESKFDFSCMGSGGGMPYNVRSLTVMFSSNKRVTNQEARYLGITSVQRLLELVNKHELIRPHLDKYPFTANNINISISFYDNFGKRRIETSSTAAIRMLSGKVIYEIAKMTTIESQGIICGKTGKYLIPPKQKKRIELTEVLRETYEEAEAIVEREKQANL